MEIDNFHQTLSAFRSRIPFKPFTIVLVNGDRFEVDHPSAFNTRDGVGVYLAPGGVPVIFDHEGVSQIIGDLMGHSSE